MTNNNPLPTFFILGAAKAGTTTLYNLLKQHPQAYLSVSKEPMFFSHDENYAKGLSWYSSAFFSNSGKYCVRGEATPHYLYWAEKTATRIQQAYASQQVKFVVIFRDPVSRAYSWYWNMIKEEQETLPFRDALQAEERRFEKYRVELQYAGSMTYGYYRGGRYASQLQAYLNLFAKRNFLFLLQEDINQDFSATIHKLLEFLELKTSAEISPQTRNLSALPRSKKLHRLLREPSWAKSVLKRFIPLPVRYQLKSALIHANMTPSVYPVLEQETANFLRRQYADEIKKLSSMIDRDLSHWLAPT